MSMGCENNHWEFLKQWFIESTENISILNHIEEEIPQQENFQLIEQFKNPFLNIISSYLTSIDPKQIDICIENLTKTFVTIKKFDEISECINNISKIQRHNELKQCITTIEEIKRGALKLMQ